MNTFITENKLDKVKVSNFVDSLYKHYETLEDGIK